MHVYLVVPDFVIVVDHRSSKAPSRVDPSASNRNGGQVNHKHSKPYWQWSQYLNKKNMLKPYTFLFLEVTFQSYGRTHRHMGVACASLGICGREDGVYQKKSANCFSS